MHTGEPYGSEVLSFFAYAMVLWVSLSLLPLGIILCSWCCCTHDTSAAILPEATATDACTNEVVPTLVSFLS